MPMRAGKLRYLVQVQRQSETTDSAGGQIRTWTTFASVYAGIEPFIDSSRAGREEFKSNQLVELDYTRIHIRYLVGVTPKDRIFWNSPNGTITYEGNLGRVFDILAVNTRDERRAEMELLCKERQ